MGKWRFLRNSNYRRTVKSILLIKMFLGLAEMTFGLVNASFSLPEWQALKKTFFAPWKCCVTNAMIEAQPDCRYDKRFLQKNLILEWPLWHTDYCNREVEETIFLVIIWEWMWFLDSFKQKIICLNWRLASKNRVRKYAKFGVFYAKIV